MTDTTEEKNPLDKLEDDTVQKIDFIIRGLELGKFDETAKKVEFLGKLSGDNAPKYIAKLLSRISSLESQLNVTKGDVLEAVNRITQLDTDKVSLSTRVQNLEDDMGAVAKGIQYLFNPDALGNNYELSDIERFISRYGARKF